MIYYADDIALFEASEAAMAETTEAIRNIAGKLGLQMSYKKTEILPIGSATTLNPVVPLGDEGNIKVSGVSRGGALGAEAPRTRGPRKKKKRRKKKKEKERKKEKEKEKERKPKITKNI